MRPVIRGNHQRRPGLQCHHEMVATLTVIDPYHDSTQQPNQPGWRRWCFYVGAVGLPALSFQWLFNGTNKDNATGSSLDVTTAGSRRGRLFRSSWRMPTDHVHQRVAHLTIKATPSTRLARWDFIRTNTLDPKAPVSSSQRDHCHGPAPPILPPEPARIRRAARNNQQRLEHAILPAARHQQQTVRRTSI